nr:MAG TPA: hypothetical protein [Caudoviricetes sp.]
MSRFKGNTALIIGRGSLSFFVGHSANCLTFLLQLAEAYNYITNERIDLRHFFYHFVYLIALYPQLVQKLSAANLLHFILVILVRIRH